MANKLGQLASALNNLPPGRLPSDTKVVLRIEEGKECKEVELESGKELLDPYKNQQLEVSDKEGSLNKKYGN